ncbi:MAG: hypothetical protein ACI9D4_000758 [Polaribacter sp.]
MKNIYWILILISIQSYSQNEQWFDFELHKNVRFKLPAENANLFDSIQNGAKMYELSAELNGVAFTGNKIIVEDIILPHNLDDLKSLYDLMSNGSKSYPNTKVVKKDIEKNGFIGQKVTLTDSIGNRLYESEVYLLDNHLFLFNCISKDNSDIKNSDYFFNQISLPKDSGIKQLTGKSELIKMLSQFKTEILIFIGIIGLIIGIILIKNYLQQRV